MDSKVLVLDRQLQGGDWGEFQMRNNFHLHQWAPSQTPQSPAAQSRMNAASGAKAQMTEIKYN